MTAEPGSLPVSLVIPTFRRPALLELCLDACFAQTAWSGAGGAAAGEILVVDNCPHRSAQRTVAALAGGAPVPLRYVAEPRPGISHARNTGTERAAGALIAFMDDDNLPGRGWLEAMVTAQAETAADAVFGRIIGLPAEPCPPRAAAFAANYGRTLGDTRQDVGNRRAYLSTANSLFRRATTLLGPAPFDPALGLVGGEDMALLRQLAALGKRFVYEPQALTLELVPTERLNRRTHTRRRFRQGQIRVRNAGLETAPGRLDTARWMAVGAAQAALHLPAALAFDLLRRPDRADHHWGGVFGGLGKLLWTRSLFAPGYGGNPLPAAAPSPAEPVRETPVGRENRVRDAESAHSLHS